MSKMAFYVNGNGEMQVKRNGISVGTATSTVTLTDIEFVNGDTLGMLLVPYTGSSLIKLCDFPQTECTTDLSYSYPIINAPLLPQMMIATFTTLTPKYNCVNNVCVQDNVNGTLTECTNPCGTTGKKYNCINNECKEALDGIYDDSSCNNECSSTSSNTTTLLVIGAGIGLLYLMIRKKT